MKTDENAMEKIIYLPALRHLTVLPCSWRRLQTNSLSRLPPPSTMQTKKPAGFPFLDIEERLQDKTEKAFRTTVSAMYDKVLAYGMNTVIVHVRAMGTPYIPPTIFRAFECLTSDRRDPGYDPLQIMLELAHAQNLQFEAWLNPYRLSRDNESTVSFKATSQYTRFLPYTIEYKAPGGQTCLSLDPARKETKDLIVNGIREIVSRYDVDGIHFDDYFYVSGMAPA